MEYRLSDIHNDLNSFQCFISMYENHKHVLFDKITIALPSFFAANMSAVLGALAYKFSENINEVAIQSYSHQVTAILQKNGFLNDFGFPHINDTNNTTISYRKFKRTDSNDFVNYLKAEFILRSELPTCSDGLKAKILQALSEMFANAETHTSSPYIFVCGQFFPTQAHTDITIVDIGQGMKNKINMDLHSNFSGREAIQWALVSGNTTKKGMPGGMGMSILTEFIKLNGGSLQIISNDGFYELSKHYENYSTLQGEFPGTIINIKIRTDDPRSYSLKGEN